MGEAEKSQKPHKRWGWNKGGGYEMTKNVVEGFLPQIYSKATLPNLQSEINKSSVISLIFLTTAYACTPKYHL